MSHHGRGSPAWQEHVRPGYAVPHLQSGPEARGGSDRSRFRQERQKRGRFEHHAAGSREEVGRGESRFLLQHPGDARDRTADRGQRQYGAGLGRALVGHGDLRHVPDHAFAIGASYAGKCTVTITSGPGFSLKQEAIGLAVMGEIPLVVVNVMRGGPSTGQPTKMEQGDLMTAIFGSHGDAPKVVMAPGTIEECFYSIITARKIAETFNMVVVVLTDAGLATSQQPFPRPVFNESWMAPPIDQSPVPEGAKPYDWDETTGLARRFIPGQPGGMHTVTGLAHDRDSHVAYDPEINEEGLRA